MPFTGPVFANVAGASSAAPGQIVQSAVWNSIHEDYSDAFTQVMEQMIALNTNRNICWMNGGFEIWQRGAGASSAISVAASTVAYTADRWYLSTGANQSSIVAANTPLSSRSQLCGTIFRLVGQTGTGAMVFAYPLDSDEIVRMRGQVVTLSCLLQAAANWSPANGTLSVALYIGTGAAPAKRNATPYTGETTVISASTNLTAGGSVTSLSATSSVVVPTNATQAEIQFTWTPVGTAGAADAFSVDDLQLECNLSSDTWTPMNFDVIDFQSMLIGCKRHYQKTFPYSTAPAYGGGLANALLAQSQAAAKIGIFWQYPVELRTNPSLLKYNPTTATSSFWYTQTVAAGTSASLTATLDTTNNTNATKGIAILGATAAVDQQAYIHMLADAGI